MLTKSQKTILIFCTVTGLNKITRQDVLNSGRHFKRKAGNKMANIQYILSYFRWVGKITKTSEKKQEE